MQQSSPGSESWCCWGCLKYVSWQRFGNVDHRNRELGSYLPITSELVWESMYGENTAFCLALRKQHPSTLLTQVFLIPISTFIDSRNTQFLTVLTLSSMWSCRALICHSHLSSEWFSGPALFLADFTLLIHSLKWLDLFLSPCTSTSTCSPCSNQPHS